MLGLVIQLRMAYYACSRAWMYICLYSYISTYVRIEVDKWIYKSVNRGDGDGRENMTMAMTVTMTMTMTVTMTVAMTIAKWQ